MVLKELNAEYYRCSDKRLFSWMCLWRSFVLWTKFKI